jgi:hypothetical protein
VLTVLETPKPISRSDVATVDHLYSRLHPLRRDHRNECVLACYQCNMQRSACESTKTYFMPKLSERIEIARATCAVTARKSDVVPMRSRVPSSSMRVIETIEEAVRFARQMPDQVKVVSLKEEYEREALGFRRR